MKQVVYSGKELLDDLNRKIMTLLVTDRADPGHIPLQASPEMDGKPRPEPPERPVLARKPMGRDDTPAGPEQPLNGLGQRISGQAQSSRPAAPEGNPIPPRKAPAIGNKRPIS